MIEDRSHVLFQVPSKWQKHFQRCFDRIETRISSRNTLGLNIGICIPKSCSPEMVTKLLTIVQKKLLRNKAILSLVPETCQVKEDLGWNLDRRDYICL